MANIFARSPYLIRIAESGQNGSKVELFLSATAQAPASPQYTLSKLIPASNDVETLYDISPYIREYISFPTPTIVTAITANPTNERVNVRVKRYKLVGSTYTLLNTTDYIAFDGYTYYEDGYNFNLGDYGLDEGDYYYSTTGDSGKIRITDSTGFTLKYTSFHSTPLVTTNVLSAGTFDAPRVKSANVTVGNKLEILDTTPDVVATYNFYPQDECKYTPVRIDFINRYGAWQTEYFFKASNDTFSVENTEYNLLQTDSFNYSAYEGQRKVFNANGKKSIKVNTGWVDETWNETLKQIMLSERILMGTAYLSKPVKINSKSTELFKHINTKQINYSLEFEFAFDVINSVI